MKRIFHKIFLHIIFFIAFVAHGSAIEKNTSPPKIGLVLSGGGARGIAQLGVLKVLERNNIPIDFIAGNSMGSVIGGLYASGYTLAEIESIVLATDWNKLLSLSGDVERNALFIGQKEEEEQGFLLLRFEGLSPVLPTGISSGQRVTNFLNELCLQALYRPKNSFDELKIPFRVVTTDLIRGKRLVIGSGSLTEALRASISVPLLFSPLKKDSMLLLDGGLISNIPVDIAKEHRCDVILAVNSASGLRTQEQMSAPWESADQMMNIMMAHENADQLHNADMVFTPAIGSQLTSDFTNLPQLISAGEKIAEKQLPALLALLQQKGILPAPDSVAQSISAIQKINVRGNLLLEEDVLQKLCAQFLQKEYTVQIRNALRETILRAYRNEGYALATIDTLEISSEGTVTIHINEGIISDIKVVGNAHTASYVIRRELILESNEILSIEGLRRGLLNIIGTGLFEQVFVDVVEEGGENILYIRVTEKSTEEVRTGIRLDSERNFQMLLEFQQVNVRDAGEEASFTFAGGFRNRTFRIRYNINRLFNSYFTGNIKAYHKFRDVYLYGKDYTEHNELARKRIGEYHEFKYGGAL